MFYVQYDETSGLNSLIKLDLQNFKETSDLMKSKEIVSGDANVLEFEMNGGFLFILFGEVIFKIKNFIAILPYF